MTSIKAETILPQNMITLFSLTMLILNQPNQQQGISET